MKKLLIGLLAALTVLSIGAYASSEPSGGAHHVDAHTSASVVDAYTSASLTKTALTGDDLAAAAELLAAHCSDLATLAETKAPGYTPPANSTVGQIMTVNPDGCVGLSSISEWMYVPAERGNDQVVLELTYGQNCLNISEPGDRGTLLVTIDGTSYLVHLSTLESDELVYTDEAYAAGEFDSHYSGAESHLSSFTITCEVLAIESTQMLIFG